MLQHWSELSINAFVSSTLQEGYGTHRTMNDLCTITPSQIVMYATEYCSDCIRAKKFFEANNIPHLRVGLEGNAEATQFVIKINNGYRSVPTIVFPDGSILVEPNWEELKAKFSNS